MPLYHSHGSQLSEWMEMNKHNPEAQQLTYIEFPKQFVWKRSTKKWSMRKKNSEVTQMHFSSPPVGDEFYMRILLAKRKGASSFEDLRTVDAILYPTFRQACSALGLLQED